MLRNAFLFGCSVYILIMLSSSPFRVLGLIDNGAVVTVEVMGPLGQMDVPMMRGTAQTFGFVKY